MVKRSKLTVEELKVLFEKRAAAQREVEEAERRIAEAEARIIDTETWPKRLALDVSVSKHSEQSVGFGREVCGFEEGSAEENNLRYEFGNLYAYFDVDAKGNAILKGIEDFSRNIVVGDVNERSEAEEMKG